MSDNFLVTTITSVWRGLPFLEGFLENALACDGLDQIQILLNISQPSSGELEIIDNYKSAFGKSLRVILNQSREGIYSSWNQSIIESNSKYLAVWNVDDLRTNNSLQDQIQALENQQGDCVIGPYKMVKKYGCVNGMLIDHKIEDNIHFMNGMRLGPFFMFRRELLSRVGMFDEQFKVAGDYDFSVRLASVAKIIRTNSLLGYYLNDNTGASTSKKPRHKLENELIHLRYGNLMKLNIGSLPEVVSKVSISSIKVEGTLKKLPLQEEIITSFRESNLTKYSEIRKIKRQIKFELRYLMRRIVQKIQLVFKSS